MITMRLKIVSITLLLLPFGACESKENVTVRLESVGKRTELLIFNQSEQTIYFSDNLQCDQSKDSIIIQPELVRPGDFLYGRLRYYSFVPPKFKPLSAGKRIRIVVKCSTGAQHKMYIRMYDADFSWTPTKIDPSHEIAYLKFEKQHSKLYQVGQ